MMMELHSLCSLKLKRWESQPVMRLKLHCCVQSLYDEMVLIFLSSYKIELKTERGWNFTCFMICLDVKNESNDIF